MVRKRVKKSGGGRVCTTCSQDVVSQAQVEGLGEATGAHGHHPIRGLCWASSPGGSPCLVSPGGGCS